MSLDITTLCQQLRTLHGSDLHLVTGEVPFLRVHGRMQRLEHAPVLTYDDVRELMLQLTNEQNVMRLFTFGEWDGAKTIKGERYRLNFMLIDGGGEDVAGRQLSISVRALDAQAKTPEELGVPQAVIDLCSKPYGLVLITGPTGSGKSTTLAALVDYINRRSACTILTIEDPIEFVHHSKMALVRQREVGRDTQSFQESIKRALRQDPDVILVGEMRDLETIEAAITLAETGHLVFATLHTPNAPGALERIIQVFPAAQHNQIQTQLALTLRGIVAQRLVPTADGNGRVAAFEVLLDTPAVRTMIRDGKTGMLIQNMLPANNMMTMERSLATLVRNGTITEDEAVANAERVEELHDLLNEAVSLDTNTPERGGRYSMRSRRP